MADSTTASITVNAAPDAVLAVIADFEAYPEWTGAVKKAEVLGRRPDGRAELVHYQLDAGAIKDEYTLTYDWSQVPAHHLYHSVAALKRTGQDFAARMIAAEALSRT